MLNSILRNHARIDFCDHVVAVVYERVKIPSKDFLMYGRVDLVDLVGSTTFHYFQIIPPTISYIKKIHRRILMYELAGGIIFEMMELRGSY